MKFEELEIGAPLGPEHISVSKDQTRRYARLYGFSAARFADDEEAKKEGLPGMILPGNLTLGLLTKLVTDWIGASGARLLRMGTTYRVPVHPERTLTLKGFVTHTYPARRQCEIDLWMEDEDGERLATATATVEFPEQPAAGTRGGFPYKSEPRKTSSRGGGY